MLNGQDAFLLGFEDVPINRADLDYNDLMFVVQASSDAAIDESGVLSSPLQTVPGPVTLILALAAIPIIVARRPKRRSPARTSAR